MSVRLLAHPANAASLHTHHSAQVEAAAAAAKVQLPADMLETARTVGIRSTALSAYLRLQVPGTSVCVCVHVCVCVV